MNQLSSLTAPPRSLRAAALLAAALATGCATAKPRTNVVWPTEPETARIRYLRSFSSTHEMSASWGRMVLRAIFPFDPAAAILSPLGLALSPDEKHLYVACGYSHRLVKVNLGTGAMDLVGAKQKPELVSPVGVGVDAEGNVYVADRVTDAVQVYDAGGKFLRRIGQGALEHPTALAVDRRAQLVYVVSGATEQKTDHRVEVFSLAGAKIRTLGKRGELPGEFNFPSGLAVAPDGSLYVSDMLNFRVQAFDREGALIAMFGENGQGKVGAFDKIKGIAFDTFKNLYVVDSMQGVQIFNSAFQPLLMFAAPPLMNVPGAIAIDSRNHIFVADFGANRVHEFELINTTAADSAPRPLEPSPAPAKAPNPK